MNTSNKAIAFVLISLMLVGCNYKQEKPKPIIIYTNDALNNWRNLKLQECAMQVQIIVLGSFEGRINTPSPMTEDEVKQMHGFLMDRCVSYNKLDI